MNPYDLKIEPGLWSLTQARIMIKEYGGLSSGMIGLYSYPDIQPNISKRTRYYLGIAMREWAQRRES